MARLAAVAFLVVAAVANRPGEAQPVRRWTDTAVVESTIREVFAAPPSDMEWAATNHAKQEASRAGKDRHLQAGGSKTGKGYHHKESSSGDDGYNQYDAFHTTSGNQYGYAKKSSFNNNKKGGKNKKVDDDAGYEESNPDVEVVEHGDRVRKSPRSQSLQDASGDATVDHENTKYRRALNEDDSFFAFSGGDNEQQDDDGAQQQQADDDDDDGEAAEQQEADDDDDDGEGAQQKKQDDGEDYDD